MKYRSNRDLDKLKDYVLLENMLGQEFLVNNLATIVSVYGVDRIVINNRAIMSNFDDCLVIRNLKFHRTDYFYGMNEELIRSKLVDSRKEFYKKLLDRMNREFVKIYQKLSEKVQKILEASDIIVDFNKSAIEFIIDVGVDVTFKFGKKSNLSVTYYKDSVVNYDLKHYPDSIIEDLESFILQNEI